MGDFYWQSEQLPVEVNGFDWLGSSRAGCIDRLGIQDYRPCTTDDSRGELLYRSGSLGGSGNPWPAASKNRSSAHSKSELYLPLSNFMVLIAPMTVSASTRLLVTFATYNERETLPGLVEAILQQLPTADILVVDDNSPDGTGDWCDEKATIEPRLQCLHRAGKLGLGTATIAAFKYAIEHDYDFVLNMDADFSHDPSSAPKLMAAMHDSSPEGEADVVIGSRYIAGGSIEGWPLLRHCMSRAVNAYARLLLRLPTRDCSGAFRCYRVSLLRQIDFQQVVSRGYSFQEEILWLLKRQGARFRELPIKFVNRQQGASKINLREAISAAWILVRLRLQAFTGR